MSVSSGGEWEMSAKAKEGKESGQWRTLRLGSRAGEAASAATGPRRSLAWRKSMGDLGGEETVKAVFVAGFEVAAGGGRGSLEALVWELVPHYYVSVTGRSGEGRSVAVLRRLVAGADAMLFLLSEGSLANRRSLLALQFAWELMVPVLLVRAPRTRLALQPLPHSSQPQQRLLNLALVRQILQDHYPQAILYDGHQQHSSAKLLRARLRAALLQPIGPESRASFMAISPDPTSQISTLRLPPIPGRRKSKVRRQLSHEPAGNGISSGPAGNGNSGPAPDEHSSSGESGVFHSTQYLVFPQNNSPPRVIQFPNDLLDEEEPEAGEKADSIGSSSSLDGTFDRAIGLNCDGNVSLSSTAPPSPPDRLGDL